MKESEQIKGASAQGRWKYKSFVRFLCVCQQAAILINSSVRTCLHRRWTPSGRVFSRPAALKNLEIHPVFLRFFALQDGKIPRPSGILRLWIQVLKIISCVCHGGCGIIKMQERWIVSKCMHQVKWEPLERWHLSGGSFCYGGAYLSLAVPVKPLADIVARYTRCDRHKKSKNGFQMIHPLLLPVSLGAAQLLYQSSTQTARLIKISCFLWNFFK